MSVWIVHNNEIIFISQFIHLMISNGYFKRFLCTHVVAHFLHYLSVLLHIYLKRNHKYNFKILVNDLLKYNVKILLALLTWSNQRGAEKWLQYVRSDLENPSPGLFTLICF